MISDARIAGLRRISESAMMDTCVIVTIATTYDAYGGAVTAETESAPMKCRFIPQMSFSTRAQEYVDASGTVQRIGAAVQLPVAKYESVSTKDRIRITKTHREAVPTPMTFDVMGDPQLGIAYVHVGLQNVSR